MTGTTLTGSEKQVAWAEEIRAEVLDRLATTIGEDGWEGNGDEPDSARYHAYREFLETIPAAKTWIDWRESARMLASESGIEGYEFFAAHPEITEDHLRRGAVPVDLPERANIFYAMRDRA